jgi:hypothetical protein
LCPKPAGALTRIFKAVQDLLENENCIDSIRTDLRIVGTEKAQPNLETVQPAFTGRIVSGQVFIDWNWGGLSDFLDLFQLQVNRGAGWVDLAYDTTPGYTDTNPFPRRPRRLEIPWPVPRRRRRGGGVEQRGECHGGGMRAEALCFAPLASIIMTRLAFTHELSVGIWTVERELRPYADRSRELVRGLCSRS